MDKIVAEAMICKAGINVYNWVLHLRQRVLIVSKKFLSLFLNRFGLKSNLTAKLLFLVVKTEKSVFFHFRPVKQQITFQFL